MRRPGTRLSVLQGPLTEVEVFYFRSLSSSSQTPHTPEMRLLDQRLVSYRSTIGESAPPQSRVQLCSTKPQALHRSPVTSTICARQKSIHFNAIPSHRYSQGQISGIFRIRIPRSLTHIDICFAVCKYEITSSVHWFDKEVIESKYDTDIPNTVTQRGRHFCN